MTIKITQAGVIVIVSINGNNYIFEDPIFEDDHYEFKNKSSSLKLIITTNGEVNIISTTQIMQLKVSGETCEWAPIANSRNNLVKFQQKRQLQVESSAASSAASSAELLSAYNLENSEAINQKKQQLAMDQKKRQQRQQQSQVSLSSEATNRN